MNKIVAIRFLCVCILLSLLMSACGGTGTISPTEKPAAEPVQPTAIEEVTINVLHNWGPSDSKGPVLQKIFDDCMADNPGLKIIPDIQTDVDIPTKAETAFLAEQEPELVFSNQVNPIDKWTDSGLAVSVNDYLTQWGLDGKFRDKAIKTWTDPKGQVVGFPLEGYNWPMWYNTKIFEELNLPLPTTWDEVLADTPAIKDAGYEVVAIGSGDSGWYLFQTFLLNSMTTEEVTKFAAEGHLADYPNAVKAFEQFVTLRDAGVFPKDAGGLQEEVVNNMFFTGKAAMWPGGSWYYGELPAEMAQFVTVAGVPLTTPTVWNKQIIMSGDEAKGIYITRNGVKKLDAVKKVIQCIYTPENIGNFVEEAGMPPPLKEVDVDESKLSPVFAQTLQWGDQYQYVSLPVYAPGVDISQVWKDMWLPTTTADMMVQTIDQAYVDGLGK